MQGAEQRRRSHSEVPEEFYRTIADFTYDWEEWIGPDGAYRYVSPSVERLTGYTPDELIADPDLIQKIIHPEDLSIYAQHCARATPENQDICELEFRILHRSGELRWISHYCQPVTLPDGGWGGRRASNRDITQGKQNEATAELYKQLTLAFMNDPNQLYTLVNPDGSILFTSPSMAQRLNTSADELVGKSLYDLFPPEIAQARAQVLAKALQTGEIIHFLDQGSAGIYDTSVIPIQDARGEILSVALLGHDISERVRAEQALRQSEERYRKLVEASPDGIILVGLEGRITDANQPMLTMLGYDDLADLQAHAPTLFDLIPEEERSHLSENIAYGIEHGSINGLEYPVRCKDGKLLPTESSGAPLLDENGQPYAFMGIVRDISERKHAEQSLRESHRIISALLNAPSDIALVLDPNATVLYANETATKVMRTQVQDMLGKCIWDFFPPERVSLRRQAFERALQTGHPQRIEDPMPNRLFDSTVFPVLDERGTGSSGGTTSFGSSEGKVTHVAIFARDITERVRAEQALRQSEERYRKLVEASSDGVVLAGLDGQILEASQQFLDILGYASLEELHSLGKTAFDMIAQEDVPRMQACMQSMFVELKMKQVEFTSLCKDGRAIPTENSGVLLFDAQGQPQAFLGLLRDVSERQQAQQALQQAHAELEQRVAERTAELAEANQQLRAEIAERQRAEERIRSHARRAEALARLAGRINAHLNLQAVLDSVCEEAKRALDFPFVTLQLYDETSDTLAVAASLGFSAAQLPKSAPLPRPIYERFLAPQASVVLIPDAQQEPNVYNRELVSEMNVRTVLSAPITHNGELIGALNLASVGEVHLPGSDELELIKALADQAATAIAHARLFEQVSENQERLKALSQKLVETQEAERQHLARELHDEIGQKLTYLALLLDADHQLAADAAASLKASNLQSAHEMTAQLLQDVRHLSLRLRPGTLDTLGLLPTLHHHFDEYTRQTGIGVHFKQNACDRRFPSQVEITAFRIIQEALTNVARHARTASVQVRLWCDERLLGLQIEDGGRGFNVKTALAARASGGLSGIQERIALCNGEIEIESTPGRGTCLTAEIPIA